MAKSANQRSYHAFVREARERGLSLKEAQQTYRNVKDHLGRTPRAVDIERHPRIFKKEAERAEKEVRRSERAAARAERARERAAAEAPPPPAPAAGKAFKSLSDYIDWYEDWDYDYDYEEADSTIDTGKKK